MKFPEMQKLKYLKFCLQKQIDRCAFNCPSCGCSKSTLISRKYIVTQLRRCESCMLLFRTPTTTAQENKSFYQEEYRQGFTTDCPSDEVLSHLIKTAFRNSDKDYSSRIELLEVATGGNQGRLFDFGCSWGYGSWQLKRHGFDVEAFEISSPRANYAREKLGVLVHSSLTDIPPNSFDICFSSHVLEHVPSVKETIDFGLSILRPGGLFIAFTPNGAASYRAKNRYSWEKSWSMVHPNLLDDEYYQFHFGSDKILLLSDPYAFSAVEKWHNGITEHQPLTGKELLFLLRN